VNDGAAWKSPCGANYSASIRRHMPARVVSLARRSLLGWHAVCEDSSVHKGRVLVVLAVVAATASGVVYYWSTRSPAAIAPLTAPVTHGSVVEAVDATGTVEAVTTVLVGTQVSGTIQTLGADFNSTVRKGQVIARLDPSLFRTQVDQAAATVARLEADVERANVTVTDAQLKLRRARDLSARQLIPSSELEAAESNALQADAALKSARAQVTQARASLTQAQVNLGHTIITAPINGIVISRNVDVGQTVAASMQAPTLFVVARDLTRMQVRASVGEADIGRIQAGQAVGFRVDAYPDELFSGTVSQIRLQPVVEQNVVSYTTVIDVPNPDMKLKPGMTATVTVEVAREDNVLRIPNSALRFQPTDDLFLALGQTAPELRAGAVPATPGGARQTTGGGRGATQGRGALPSGGKDGAARARVWVFSEGQLEAATVRTGITDGTTTAILGGDLEEGSYVVTGVTTAPLAAAQTTASPLLPFGGRRPGGGARQTPAGPGPGR